MATVLQPQPVDPRVWKACAGDGFTIPAVGSLVIYFPQGHAEQDSSPVDLSAYAPHRTYLCLVTAVELLVNPETDEVFSRIHLQPVPLGTDVPSPEHLSRCRFDSAQEDDSGAGRDGFRSFAKSLTLSDVHRGGGLSIPKFDACSLFLPLDYEADPPAQDISMRDVQGIDWEFRHAYRGTPTRHMLTTGWSNFVSEKSLVQDDSVVFMRNAEEKFFIGVRRTRRRNRPTKDYSRYAAAAIGRNARGRISPLSVIEAVKAAEMSLPFEVLYYPNTRSPEFVVSETLVKTAMAVQWNPGMRIRMYHQVPSSTKMIWFRGTVSEVVKEAVSPWRKLQVTWDKEDLRGVRSVSPWQVELISTSPNLQSPSPVMQKPMVQQDLESLDDKENSFLYKSTRFKSMSVDSVSPLFSDCRTFPAGMQGARHDSNCISSLLNSTPVDISPMFSEGPYNIAQNNDVCKEVNNRNNSESLGSPLCSQESIQDPAVEVCKPRPCHPIKEVSGEYFMLFGNIIQVKQPVDNNANEKQGIMDGLQIKQPVHYDANEIQGSKDDQNQLKQTR